MLVNRYSDFDADFDDFDYEAELRRKRIIKWTIIGIIIAIVLMFIIITIISLNTENPYLQNGVVERNDFDNLDISKYYPEG